MDSKLNKGIYWQRKGESLPGYLNELLIQNSDN